MVAKRTDSTARPPLEGIRIVEVASWISGPLAGRMLADLGADVVKVEQPPRGDAMRAYGRRVNRVGALVRRVRTKLAGHVTDPLADRAGKELRG
jgi:crotonobetainyl-CoA:carnitine CoA-transferase CaiB-like acyl-CoA transferase